MNREINNNQKIGNGPRGAQINNRRNYPGGGNNYFAGKQDRNNAPNVAKASKKLNPVIVPALATEGANKGNRPTIEIYKPPSMRHSGNAKSTEDISSMSSSPMAMSVSSTRPSAAGTKQQFPTMSSSSSSTSLHNVQHNTTPQNYNLFQKHPHQQGARNTNYRNDTRTYSSSKQGFALEREKSRSSKTLNSPHQNGKGVNNLRPDYDDYYERMRRSQTPPPSLAASRQLSCPDNLSKKGISGGGAGADDGKMKRQRSFIKDLPKKKGTFTEKEAGEARMLLMALDMAQDPSVAEWIAGHYSTEECANTVGQVLVQLAIEHTKDNKATRLITKLSSLLMECNSGDAFHKGLVSSSYRYFECRELLRAEHFQFWLKFVNFLSELHASMGFTYEGELSKILFQLYDYMLQSPILDQLKIEELESMISSLMNVGYDLERQCPDQLAELRNTLRNAFINVEEPWARKMILLLIELSASNWKLPPDANEYYFQTSSVC